MTGSNKTSENGETPPTVALAENNIFFAVLFFRFIVKKEAERSEVKVQQGPSGFPFKKNERYVFKYSFRAVESMKVATRFTHLGQIKGSKGGYMIKGDPIYSLTANKYGLMVRFSNKDTIEDFHPGLEKYLNWEDATGEWVDVKITTVFGRSMEVRRSVVAVVIGREIRDNRT